VLNTPVVLMVPLIKPFSSTAIDLDPIWHVLAGGTRIAPVKLGRLGITALAEIPFKDMDSPKAQWAGC